MYQTIKILLCLILVTACKPSSSKIKATQSPSSDMLKFSMANVVWEVDGQRYRFHLSPSAIDEKSLDLKLQNIADPNNYSAITFNLDSEKNVADLKLFISKPQRSGLGRLTNLGFASIAYENRIDNLIVTTPAEEAMGFYEKMGYTFDPESIIKAQGIDITTLTPEELESLRQRVSRVPPYLQGVSEEMSADQLEAVMSRWKFSCR